MRVGAPTPDGNLANRVRFTGVCGAAEIVPVVGSPTPRVGALTPEVARLLRAVQVHIYTHCMNRCCWQYPPSSVLRSLRFPCRVSHDEKLGPHDGRHPQIQYNIMMNHGVSAVSFTYAMLD